MIIIMLSFLAVLNGVGGTANLGGGQDETGLYYSIGQTFMFTAVYCVIVSVFIGVVSIAEERRNHSVNIILTKPLYRRDLIAGKLLGLNAYMLSIIVFSIILAALMLILFYKSPTNPVDFLAKIGIYVFIVSIYTSLNLAIALLIGTVFKDILISAALAMAYIFIDGYTGLTLLVPGLDNFSPRSALCRLYINDRANLQSITLSIEQWINTNLANVFFFIMAIMIISLIAITVYMRSDDL